MPQYATVFNPRTKERKRVVAGDPNAFAGGFQLEKQTPRASALEGSPEQILKDATAAYRAKFLTGFDVPQATEGYAKTIVPDLAKTRADLEKGYYGATDPNSPDYVDPSNIISLVGQRMQGGRDYLSRVSQSVGNLWDKGVQSSRFGVEDAQTAASRAQALLDEQRQRMQGLEDYEKKAQIDRRYAGSSDDGTGYVSGLDSDLAAAREAISQGANPQEVSARLYGAYPKQRTLIDSAMQGAGYSTERNKIGGLSFFGPGNTPIKADQYAAGLGKNVAEVLAGSQDPRDIRRIQQITAIKSGTDPASMEKKYPAQRSWWQKLLGQ